MAERAAAIHDLGYKRYEGERRAQGTRYRVIARNVLGMAWRGWWRLRLWVIGSAMITVGGGVAMYMLGNQLVRAVQRQGVPVPAVDAVLPFTMSFFTSIAFVLSLTTAAAVIANDLRAGSFEFYFSRALRPLDYVLGKALGVASVLAIAVLAGPLTLALVRIGLSGSLSEIGDQLALVPRAAAAGAVATVGYALPALGFSALSHKRAHTMAAWAIFYVLIGQIAIGISFGTGNRLVAIVDLKRSVTTVTDWILGVRATGPAVPPVWAAAAMLGLLSATGLALVVWRVARAERRGLGGG
jgi:ABC-2 type transport system permease protein